jgi:hypothetical protein
MKLKPDPVSLSLRPRERTNDLRRDRRDFLAWAALNPPIELLRSVKEGIDESIDYGNRQQPRSVCRGNLDDNLMQIHDARHDIQSLELWQL